MNISDHSGAVSSMLRRTAGWHGLSLRVRFFTVAAFTLSVTVLLVVLLQSMLSSREQMARVRSHELPAQLQAVASSIQAQLNLAIAGSEALANHTYVQAWVAAGGSQEGELGIEAVMARVQRSLQANAVFVAAALPDGVRYFHYEDGRLQSRRMEPGDSSNGWYFNFVRGTRTHELNLDNNPLSQQLLMFVNYRSSDPATSGLYPAVVAGGGMGMNQLAQLINTYKVGNAGRVMLVRPDGVVDVHHDPSQVGHLNLREQSGFSELLANDWQPVRDQNAQQPAIIETSLNGEPAYIAALYLPDLQRYLVAQLPTREITAGIARTQWMTLAAGAALLVLALTVLLPWSKLLLQPLESLQRQIAAVTDSLDLGTRLHTRDGAEIGRMCVQLNRFLERLHTAFTEVRETIDGIHGRAENIASGNRELSGRTETQAAALEQSSASMTQLADSVQQNAESARQARTLSSGASTVAHQGGALMGQVVSNMQSIAQSSERIGDIVGVIDSIAFQTNILALNAAVEAARAGEQGRGFAVVASEVRALAKRSGDAAHEIRGLIHESTQRVSSGVQHVEQAGTTMQEIVSSVQRVSHLIQSIADASEEQSHSIANVIQAAAQMEGVTQKNATLVEEVAAAANHLESEAQRLHTLMEAFRMDTHSGYHPAILPVNTPVAMLTG